MSMFIALCNALDASPDFLLRGNVDKTKATQSSEVAELWEKATPAQAKLINAMIHAAAESLEEN